MLAGRDDYGIAWLDSYSTLESLPRERTAPRRESQTAGLLPEYMRGSREILGRASIRGATGGAGCNLVVAGDAGRAAG
ncbi:MAG TPA: hypothetical protein DCP38_11135 [Acidobacteria bacterium]|nr:hypothetical protein [Acidobacteriota bacterium]